MKVIIREAAEADLDHIAEWITQDSPSGAVRMVKTIRDRINFLETDELAHMGRPGLVEGHVNSSNIPTSSSTKCMMIAAR
jgi:plasmid stabilization system protein ParE